MIKNIYKKAFTLIELTIVIAIIAVLAAVLLPNFANVYNSAQELEVLDEQTNTQLTEALNAITSLTEE